MEICINTTFQGINWPALPSPNGAGRLAALFQEEMGDGFNFDIQQVENIMRIASGKYEEYISELLRNRA